MQTDEVVIQQLGTQYTSIVCIFSFGVASQVMLERMLAATGRPIGSVYSLLAGTLINVILDPILIFGLLGAFFQALGHSKLTMATSITEFVLMMTAAMILSRIGSVYTVWIAFPITELVVVGMAVLFMIQVNRKTIRQMPDRTTPKEVRKNHTIQTIETIA